jgi:hypothetical protein
MMATATIMAQPSTGIEPDDLYRFPLELYRSIGDLGLLLPDDRVELLDGLLVKKMTKGPRHSTATHRVFMRFVSILPAGWLPRLEQPIELPGGPLGDSAPEPDIAIVPGIIEDYATRHPGPAEVALVVQIATSPKALARDRQGLGRYAWASLPVVWIVDLTNARVEIYTAPSGPQPGPGYGHCEIKKSGDIATIAIAGTELGIAVDELVR